MRAPGIFTVCAADIGSAAVLYLNGPRSDAHRAVEKGVRLRLKTRPGRQTTGRPRGNVRVWTGPGRLRRRFPVCARHRCTEAEGTSLTGNRSGAQNRHWRRMADIAACACGEGGSAVCRRTLSGAPGRGKYNERAAACMASPAERPAALKNFLNAMLDNDG